MIAEWLNSTFFSLDQSAFHGVHNLAGSCGKFLTPIIKAITLLGDGGWAFILLGVILLLFKNTRKAGVTVLIAIVFGALFTNILLKETIARPRPYVTSEEYKLFWLEVNGVLESKNSFPSGHTTTAAASMMALFLTYNKKWSWVLLLVAALMGFTRIYLVVHYLTDVIAGFLVGVISGALALLVRNAIYKLLDKYSKNKIVGFILNFDLINSTKSIIKK